MREKIFLIALITLFVFSSCSVSKQTEKKDINFTDDDGVEINLHKPAERIISMYSAHTENIYLLGAGDKLIGGYKTCVYPPEAAFLPMYDYNGDPEEIIAANPDVLLIRPFIRQKAPEYIKLIENSGICVVSLYPESLEEFDEYINKLAKITGKEENAVKELENFHIQLNEIKALTDKEDTKSTVFFEATDVDIRTVTPNSMAANAISLAGGINIAHSAAPISKGSTIAPFGIEKVLENADKIDVYVSQRGSMNSGGNLISINERPGYGEIKAVKNNRVFVINEKIVSSPSFRYVKGVREFARFMYPDAMDDISEYNNDEPATRRSFANMVVKAKHMPIYLPTSSSYYQTEQRGHTFGMFEDVSWRDSDFDYIETAVVAGYVLWDKDGDKELFNPEKNITRDELAQCIFIMGDFKNNGRLTSIDDLSQSSHQRIVQILVDNGIFELNNGLFEPSRTVTNNEVLSALSFAK